MILKKNINHKPALGFTLIEVMIALAILAIASASLVKVAGTALNQSAGLEERTIAYWVAANTLTQMQLERAQVTIGDRTEVVIMASREWEVSVKTSETADADLKRADVKVKLKSSPKLMSLATLTGFIGKH